MVMGGGKPPMPMAPPGVPGLPGPSGPGGPAPGMGPMGGGLPVPPPPPVRPSRGPAGAPLGSEEVSGILDRQDAAMSQILGEPEERGAKSLTPREQYRRYQEHTRNTAWVKKLLAAAPDEHARYWLQIIDQYGIEGMADYVQAMQDLGKTAGRPGGAARR